jgi:threonine dehydrogenase-like Zn-dependent dehydrogenase
MITCALPSCCHAQAKNPLKIYILAGQSDMTGMLKTNTFEHVKIFPETVEEFKDLFDKYVGNTQQNLEFPHAPVMYRRELKLMASRNALSRDFTRIIGLIENGMINTTPWITHHATFDDVPDIFPSWIMPETGVIKAVADVS